MRRITTWLLGTISALVLLFSYHTSTSASSGASVVAQGDAGTASGGAASGGTDSGGTASDGTDPGAEADGTDSGSTDPGSSAASGTYTGDAVSTRFGDVQVEITVEDGTITASKVTQVPWSDHRDQEINAVAVPLLNQEAVDAQSADIDMVSGATYTSQGYVASLQSAIDQANL